MEVGHVSSSPAPAVSSASQSAPAVRAVQGASEQLEAVMATLLAALESGVGANLDVVA